MNGVKIWLIGTSRYLFLFLFVFVASLSAQLENGLVAYFPLDGNGTDLISGANGTIYGATPAENRWGDSGKAYSFDGTDDYIEVPFQSTYSTDAFSFSLWVKPTATSSQHSSPLTFRASTRGHILYKTPQNNWAAWVGTGGSWAENVLGQIEVGNWQFIASTYASGSYKGYLDGDLVATISPSFSKNTYSPLRIGAGKTEGSPDFFFAGVVDEVRLYNRALSAAEVQQLQVVDHKEVPPSNLRTLGGLAITENSSAGTVVGEFNATDPNGDTVTYALMPALPSEFSPVLWLDANDSSTVIQSSGAVSRWEDKSGNNYHFTQDSDTSRQPIYSTTSLNGMPAITFDGSNDYLSISSRLGFSANPDLSVFAVTSFISNIAADNRIFQLGKNAHSLAVAGGTGSWSWRFNGGNEVYNPVSLNTAAQQAWVRQAGSNYQASQFFYNGTEQTRVIGASDTTVPSDTAAVSFVGAGASDGSWTQNLSSHVRISELIVLNDSSEVSRRGVETYLARKWGLTYTQATSNGIFEIESNGTLKSLVSLDRETVATLPITVRATDPNGNFTEEDFSVTVVDDGLEDTDSDGFLDSVEYQEGSDPISNASIPGLEYGLTAWYPFDGNASDMSGNGRHGTAHNGAGWAAGKVGQALSLDGVDDYMDAGDFEIGGAVTFAAWVKYDAFKSWSRVFDFGNGENSDNILMGNYQTSAASRFQLKLPSVNPSIGSSNLTLNSWLHRAGVVEANGNMRLYLNGSLEDSNSNTSALPTLTRTQQYVGKSNWSADGYLDGLIDDFRIYNRALSATEVSNLHQLPASDADGDGYTYVEELEAGTNPNSSLSKPSLMDGLLLWYPLDGNTSDMSGNDRHASLSNANGSTSGFVSGKVLKALDLDGVDDYLSVPHDSGLDLRRTLSLSMWLKLDAIPSTGYSAIMYKGGGSGGSSRTYSLWLENGSRFIHATSADSTDQQNANSANSAFTNNSWMHLVMLLDRYNGSIKVFKDKALVANSTVRSTNTVSSQNPLLFGKSQESNSEFSDINGQMDDIRLYDRVLYSFEIEDLFDAVATDTDSDGLNDAEEMLLDTNLTSSDTDGDGLTDFQEVKGFHTYEQINGSYTWSAAKADAESRGGYLATVTSLEEKNEIELVRTTNSWLGGSDTQTEGTWAWVTGEPWSYHFWNTSEPNGGTGENYLITDSSDGRWNDLGVGNVPYILEKEYFSNPKLIDSDSDGYPDLNETQLGTDPSSYDSSPSPSNTAPTNLLLSQSQINENQPVGASVGSFSATDADGDNLFYYLVAGAGDTANSYFTLDVNGSLQTAVVFDYENNASTYSIRVQVKDEFNASIEGNFSVTLLDLDDTAAVINLNGDAQVTHEAGSPYLDANASWTDSVDGSGTILASGQVNTGTPGSYVLSFNYTDAAGNAAQTVTRTVQVVDSTAPVISLLGDANITHEAGNVYLDANASRNDAVDGGGVVYASGEVNASVPGVYVLTYDYTDAAGNAAQTVIRTVHVVDSTAPVISLLGDASITHEGGNPYLDANASWTDAVDGSGTILASGQVNTGTPGSYVLSFNYTDVAGNVAETVTRTLTVVDTTVPVITLNGDGQVTHEAGNPYLDANASWTDAVDGSGMVYASGEVNASDPGVYVLSYDYTDAAGNVAQTVTRTVNVVDTTVPVIALHGDIQVTHEAGTPYLDANATWSDAVDGSGTILASGQVNTGTPGSYVLSFNYTDAAGNVAETVTRTLTVVDTTVPVITLNGDGQVTHEAGGSYLDANTSWSDAVDGRGVVYASGEVNASDPGVYVLSYDYTDVAGNAAQTVTRTVHVVDSTAPVISLLGDANITHEAGNPYLDANASWTDAVDGSGMILASGEVNPSIPGTYLLGYDYTDVAGNSAQTVTRKVEVINLSPNALYVQGDSNLSVFENEPNGTWVANFEGFDGNPDHVLLYELVRVSDGNQSAEQNGSYGNLSEFEHLNVFHLDTNGSLTTLRPIDYEIDPLKFEIVVRITDQHGAYFESPFLVNVLNVVEDLDNDGIEDHYDLDDDGDGYPDEVEKTYGFNPRERWEYPEVPIVRTLELIEEGNETLRFGMEILAEGGFEKLQVGIEVFDLSENLLLEKVFEWNATSVAKVTFLEDGFIRGQVIRYQAYAENLAGRTFGQLMEYRVGGEMDTWWASDLELTGGWRESIWMGTYLPNLKNNWIYHLKLGWLFIEVDQQGGHWMWMSNNGWLWTNQETWPFLWSNESADWLYPVYSGSNLYFYDYQTESFR